MLRRVFLAAVLICLSAPAAHCAPLFKSGPENNALLELYTAEGCPSCPPAEDWVNALKGREALWDDYVPVVFHVDYWNRPGWTDKFAQSGFSTRQVLHSAHWKIKTLYTPCVLLNGAQWEKWRRTSMVPKAPSKDAGVLSVEDLGHGRFRAHYVPGSGRATNYKLNAAFLGFGVRVQIGGGRNKGKQRVHEFLALNCQQVAFEERSGVLTADFVLGTLSDPKASRYGLAAWVTQDSDTVPIQATGGYLKNGLPS